MRIQLLAIGDRMPTWVADGFDTYSRRLRGKIRLQLVEVPAPRRGKNADIARLVRNEGQRLLAKVEAGAYRIALDEGGRVLTTQMIASRLSTWCEDGSNVAFFMGGADGLSSEAIASVNEIWSLSSLTLAHSLARIVFAEQVYRAYSLMEGLPYHRGERRALEQ